MRALQYREIGNAPEIVEVPTPTPGPGQVRLRVTAAGACHSDIFLMGLPTEAYVFGLPLTLGHEGAGIVDAVGAGVAEALLGESVAIYGPWGCGRCRACAEGRENYCPRAAAMGIAPPGLGAPGSMADHVIVDTPRHLLPLGDLDPVATVCLTDAGLTPYHAIKSARGVLGPGSVALVIGAGGLGHVGIQILRAISPATVVAVDTDPQKLTLATDVGAHHVVLSDGGTADGLRALSSGGFDAVFDFVAAQATIDLGRTVLRMGGEQWLIGVAAGVMPVGLLAGPYEASVRSPYWGSLGELYEVLDLARSGHLHVATETFSLDDAPEAYAKLHAGSLRGRAVVIP
jgi:propanol-preferring alcohol dehydrogenase